MTLNLRHEMVYSRRRGRRGSAMSAVSGTGSASGAPASQPPQPHPPSAKTDGSPTKDKNETTVAIETVD
ncbi:hypothetical protein Pmani_027033 [Petrolisthes manimaculis]|uniref:Uncharacterized protein n=1 Tax=Petrolisthes manimaculis TaxID=1843537 RepID=A0AAE1P2G1_9EUCA|nr:hypothetical protein Pmani_027033 [Petrolisthes manimaculis]